LATVTYLLASAIGSLQRPKVRIILNDQPRETVSANLATLLAELDLANEPGVAAAVNGQVIPRSQWAETRLAEGVQILVIRAAQGG
jgi:sulfur carrier protein